MTDNKFGNTCILTDKLCPAPSRHRCTSQKRKPGIYVRYLPSRSAHTKFHLKILKNDIVTAILVFLTFIRRVKAIGGGAKNNLALAPD